MAILTLTNDTYEEAIQSHKAILVEFWARWCTYCKQMEPVLDRMATDYEGRLSVAKVNVETETAISEKLNVMSLPAVFVYLDGQLAGQVTGYVPEQTLTNFLEQLLGE